MTAEEAYSIYIAVKLHFESKNYDCIKYNYKTKVPKNPQVFNKMKWTFAKLGSRFTTREELVNFYLANFLKDIVWVSDMINEDVYLHHCNKMQSLSYSFKNDIALLADRCPVFDDLFKKNGEVYPPIIKYYAAGDISIETMVILNKLTGFIDSDINNYDRIFMHLKLKKILKYSVFLRFDINKMKNIVLELYTS